MQTQSVGKPRLSYTQFIENQVTKLPDNPSLKDFPQGTVAWLIQKYIEEVSQDKDFGPTHLYGLRALQRSPIGKRVASQLETSHLLQHCRWRKTKGACPATCMQDMTFLRGPLGYAKGAWGMKDVTASVIKDAMPLLNKYNLVGKSRPRDRRPTGDEFSRLKEFYRLQSEHPRTVLPMAEILEFQVWSARRISETCRIKFSDVNVEKRTVVVRDMKDPKHKKGNDVEVPLLGLAWEIVAARMKNWDGNPDARIFPYSSKSASASCTKAKKALGIKNLRLHDLRREAASRLFEAGFSVQEVMLVTGHKTPVLLLRVYTKLKPEDLHQGPAAKRDAPGRSITVMGYHVGKNEAAGDMIPGIVSA